MQDVLDVAYRVLCDREVRKITLDELEELIGVVRTSITRVTCPDS